MGTEHRQITNLQPAFSAFYQHNNLHHIVFACAWLYCNPLYANILASLMSYQTHQDIMFLIHSIINYLEEIFLAAIANVPTTATLRAAMITANMPEINATDQLSIGEAAAVLGVHRNTMRRYTEQGLIKCRFRRATKRRFYLGADILRFWKSYCLK